MLLFRVGDEYIKQTDSRINQYIGARAKRALIKTEKKHCHIPEITVYPNAYQVLIKIIFDIDNFIYFEPMLSSIIADAANIWQMVLMYERNRYGELDKCKDYIQPVKTARVVVDYIDCDGSKNTVLDLQ